MSSPSRGNLKDRALRWFCQRSRIGRKDHVCRILSMFSSEVVVAEALAFVERTEERCYEAELYRLIGELTLEKFKVQGSEFNGEEEAATCFHKAIAFAQKQEAKSWRLRAATSLARLWEAEGYRLKGELTLLKTGVQSRAAKKRRGAFKRRWRLPARKVRNLSNCALPLAAAGCGSSRGRQGKTGEDRGRPRPACPGLQLVHRRL